MILRTTTLFLAALLAAFPAAAELQSTELGGELRIRARGNMNYQNTPGEPARTLIPIAYVLGRPLGTR